MKTNFTKFSLLIFALIALTSCGNDDDETSYDVPTAAQFDALIDSSLDAITQNFQFNTADGFVSFTSAKGVIINIDPSCLRLDGIAVTGTVNLEYIEVFDKGTMATTNKPTMGRMPNGDLGLLITGGEFYVNATLGGQQLDIVCNISLLVPTSLTDGTVDDEMTLWNGAINEDGDLVWDENQDAAGQGGVFGEGNNYYVSFGDFGWTNVDKFYSDPRPKTTILVDVPDGYDNENSSVYLSYDGEGTNALASLDTYTTEGYFSEHYGQIPIGLECHVIFVTEEDGEYRYAIKAVTIEADDIITFTYSETTTGTEDELVAAINAIQ